MLSLRLQNGAHETNNRHGQSTAFAEPLTLPISAASLDFMGGSARTNGPHANIPAKILPLGNGHATPVQNRRLFVATVSEPSEDLTGTLPVRKAWCEAITRGMDSS